MVENYENTGSNKTSSSESLLICLVEQKDSTTTLETGVFCSHKKDDDGENGQTIRLCTHFLLQCAFLLSQAISVCKYQYYSMKWQCNYS